MRCGPPQEAHPVTHDWRGGLQYSTWTAMVILTAPRFWEKTEFAHLRLYNSKKSPYSPPDFLKLALLYIGLYNMVFKTANIVHRRRKQR
jgi:hypothetical protein